MSTGKIFVLLLVVAYLGRIVGIALTPTKRSHTREVADALTLPLTAFMSKCRRSRELSALRVVLGVVIAMVWTVLAAGQHLTTSDVWALAIICGTLPVSDLFAAVPVSEGLAALVALFGAVVGKRVTTRTETTEEPAPAIPAVPAVPAAAAAPATSPTPTPPAPAAATPPGVDMPHTWRDGDDPHEGIA